MEQCYKCGEYKKIREVIVANGRLLKHPNPLSVVGHNYYRYDYICKDCDKATKILKKEEFTTNQKAWIKQRDEILNRQTKEK